MRYILSKWRIAAGALLGGLLAYLAAFGFQMLGIWMQESHVAGFVLTGAWLGATMGAYGYSSTAALYLEADDPLYGNTQHDASQQEEKRESDDASRTGEK